MDAIVTEALTKRFGDHVAVDRLSLRVKPGEIYAFLGLNGSGKTTTIRMLLAMVRPTAGQATVLGARVGRGRTDPPPWARVGSLVDVPRGYPRLTVRENLEVFRRLHGLEDRTVVATAIERLGLGPYADRPARTLSLGNAQRLGLAKALLHEPRLLLLDEPVNGLDPAGVVQVRELLRTLAADHGVTVFLSSHILAEVARVATRVGIIHAGRLVEEFDTVDLPQRCRRRLVVDARDRAAARAVLLGAGFSVGDEPDGMIRVDDGVAWQRPDEVSGLLVRAGVAPTRISVEQEDLESHFLRAVGLADATPTTREAA